MTRSCKRRYSSVLGVASAGVSVLSACGMTPSISPVDLSIDTDVDNNKDNLKYQQHEQCRSLQDDDVEDDDDTQIDEAQKEKSSKEQVNCKPTKLELKHNETTSTTKTGRSPFKMKSTGNGPTNWFGGRQQRLFSDYAQELSVHAANDRAYDLIPEVGFKIVVLGASKVGKTSIIQRFLYQRFDTKHKPTVEDNFFVEFPYNKYTININIIDTSGTYQFPAMKRLAINSGDAFILVYSVDDPDSFEELRCIRDMILEERHRAVEEQQMQATQTATQLPSIIDSGQYSTSLTSSATPSSACSSSASGASTSHTTIAAHQMNASSTCPVGNLNSNLNPGRIARVSLEARLISCPACIRAGYKNEPAVTDTLTESNVVVASLEHGFCVCPRGHLISNANLSLPPGNCTSQQAANATKPVQTSTSSAVIAPVSSSSQTPVQAQIQSQLRRSSHQPSHHRIGGAMPHMSSATHLSSSSSLAMGDQTKTSSDRRSSTAEAALRTRRTLRPPMVIVANKCDLEESQHRVNRDLVEPMVVLGWSNGFCASSAAHDIEINEIFQQVLRQAKQPPALADAIVSKRRRSLPPVLPPSSSSSTNQNIGRRKTSNNTMDNLIDSEMLVSRHRPPSRSGAAAVATFGEPHRTSCHLMHNLLRGMKLFGSNRKQQK